MSTGDCEGPEEEKAAIEQMVDALRLELKAMDAKDPVVKQLLMKARDVLERVTGVIDLTEDMMDETLEASEA